MNLVMIENKISAALEHENREGTVRGLLREIAIQAGNKGAKLDKGLEDLMSFVIGYVQHVPLYLKEGVEAGRKQRVPEIESVLRAVSDYWELEIDVMPDHLGLLGVIDDAYCSLQLIQTVSNNVVQRGGHSLVNGDLTDANKGMRMIIGEPAASHLDAYVTQSIGAPNMMQVINALAGLAMQSGPVFGSQPDPIWGNASASEIANTRLGAMGIF